MSRPLEQKCDNCGERMRLRTVQEGEHEGAEFFVCPNNQHHPKTHQLLPGACPVAASFRGAWRQQKRPQLVAV